MPVALERRAQYLKEWRSKHQDKMRAYRDKWLAKNPNAKKEEYERNKDKYVKKAIEWKKKNPIRSREIERGVQLRWRHRLRQENPIYYKHLNNRYYARRSNAPGKHTLKEWVAILEKHGNKCVFCSSSENIHKDHVIPLSLGGSNSADNLQPLCAKCNTTKNNRLICLLPL